MSNRFHHSSASKMWSKIGGSSGSDSSVESSMVRKPCKGHGIEATIFTSYTEDNPGRRFMRCPLREISLIFMIIFHCNTRSLLLGLLEKNNIEAQLKEKVQSEAILEQELRMIEQKLGVIEERIDFRSTAYLLLSVRFSGEHKFLVFCLPSIRSVSEYLN
ncbi:hypothetical protein ACS0TY_023588 [Phlomoides rotata]